MTVENITLNGQLVKIRRNPNGTRQLDLEDGSQVTLPKKATVFAREEVVELPSGEAGISRSLHQDPPTKVSVFEKTTLRAGVIYPNLVTLENQSFLGIGPYIDVFGNVHPKELPEFMKKIQEWGWEVEPEVLKLLGQAGLSLADKQAGK